MMSFISRIKQFFARTGETDPAKAYDLWAAGYDAQPHNLVLALDGEIFTGLLENVDLAGKTLADIGCGTGRHWPLLFSRSPKDLYGFDVSAGMLEKLKEKFPQARTCLLADELLPSLPDGSCQVLVSTLTLAHIPRQAEALAEWNRVLQTGADIILTDYHPAQLAKGGKRTFQHEGKTVAVKNYTYTLEQLRRQLRQLGWKEIRFTERRIDEAVKSFYAQQDALAIYEKFKGTPVVFGIHLKKTDDTV